MRRCLGRQGIDLCGTCWMLDVFHSFEEGWTRRSRKCNATLDSARPGRSNHPCNKDLSSPAAPISEGSEIFIRSPRPPLLDGGERASRKLPAAGLLTWYYIEAQSTSERLETNRRF